MLRYATWKVVAIIGMTLIALLVVVPSMLSSATRQSISAHVPWLPMRTIVLGLDLQGGSHVLLEIDQASVLKTQVDNLRDDVRRILREERVPITGGIGTQARGVQFRVANPDDRAKVLPKIRQLQQQTGNILLGGSGAGTLDVKESPDGLIQVTVTDAGIADKVRRAVDQSIEVLRRRVDALGTTEPNIQRQGADRILVQVPGLQDPQRLKEILGQTAKLEFRMVAEPGATDVDLLPSKETPGQTQAIERRVIVEGGDLTDAQPGFDNRSGEPVVNFKFNIRGAQRFGQTTSENVGRLLAIVLDNQVISAPRILSPITGGSGQISGRFTVQQANDLSVLLRAGAMPAKLTIVEERTGGPGLGKDSIEAGKHATYVATVFVGIFMSASYGLSGFFANIAHPVQGGPIFGLMSVLQATLTLPGIAGIVLTIGTAVDSNVLIYERIREEVHAGRSIVSAIQAGFDRAFATIIDSNSTMAIAAVILFFMGSGPVRGFAVVFILGILTTVITAVTLTRMMIALWYHYARPKALPF